MKKAARVFIILGIICGFFTIVAPIIGIKTLHRLDKATSKKSMVKWGVLSLIFCNTIGGILILCMKDEHFTGAPAAEVAAPAEVAPAAEAPAEVAAPVAEAPAKEAPAAEAVPAAEDAAPAADEKPAKE